MPGWCARRVVIAAVHLPCARMTRWTRSIAVVIAALMMHVFAGCAATATTTELTGETMGTTWSVKLVADSDPTPLAAVQRGIEAELDRVVEQMSTWSPTSDISRYNSAADDSWHVLPEGFQDVLTYALSLAAETGGAYDPTVGPLVNLWGFGPDGERAEPPLPEQVQAMKARVGWQRVRFDAPGHRVHQPGGVHLDLSSIAKGYAVDRVAIALDEAHVENYLVEIGGELRARGRKPDGDPWRVAVETPSSGLRDVSEVLELDNLSVATSGDYRIHFESGGRRYSHTIDPRTGQPVDHALVSVTVVHRDCMHADALATALTVLGPVEGMAFAREKDLAVLFIERDGDTFVEHVTPAFDAAVVHR